MPQKDPEARREYMRRWNAAHPHRGRKEYRSRPEVRERQKQYRLANLDKYAGYQRNRRARNPRETLVEQAKFRAKRDGLPFNISVETLLWPTHCPILGIELDYNKNPGNRKLRHGVPTLDRKTNAAGYVLGNVFVISHRANRLKSDATSDELYALWKYSLPVS